MKPLLQFCLFITICFTTQLSFAQTLVGNIITSVDTLDGTGDAVAISDDGTRIIVGVDYHPGYNPDTVGYARVYELNGNAWQQLGQDITEENVNDEFGNSVCISSDGNRIAIGGSQGVMVYDLVGSAWQQVGDRLLLPSLDTLYDKVNLIRFSDDGNTIAISSLTVDTNITVYEYSANNWVQKGNTFPEDIRGEFGLSSDGNRIVLYAGSPQREIRVYEFQNNAWNILGDTIMLPAGYRWAEGIDISGNGNRVVFSLENMDNTSNGAIATYELVSGQWVQNGDLLNVVLFTSYGVSLRLSHDGNTFVYANAYDYSVVDETSVSVYKYNGLEWQLLGNVLQGATHDESADGVVDITADGTRIVMGGVKTDTNDLRGYVKVYDYSDLIGIEEGQGALNASLYPNPTKDLVNINLEWSERKNEYPAI